MNLWFRQREGSGYMRHQVIVANNDEPLKGSVSGADHQRDLCGVISIATNPGESTPEPLGTIDAPGPPIHFDGLSSTVRSARKRTPGRPSIYGSARLTKWGCGRARVRPLPARLPLVRPISERLLLSAALARNCSPLWQRGATPLKLLTPITSPQRVRTSASNSGGTGLNCQM